MRLERFALAGKHIVGKHVQPSSRDDFRIELSNRARRRIPRIGKARLAGFFALGVNFFKYPSRQIRFATHLDLALDSARSVSQLQRYTANCLGVGSHVFAAKAIAARDSAHKHSVFVVN